LARQILFELIFGPLPLKNLKFGPLVQKVGHPCPRICKFTDKNFILRKMLKKQFSK
jgi:hypothetical protein